MPAGLVFGEGHLFAHRYRIVRLIGAGGMGAVYEALQTDTGRRRALKVMLPQGTARPELRARFEREARLAGQIESAFVVDVLDVGVDAVTGLPFLVMELLAGEDMGARVRRAGALPRAEAIRYLDQAARALDRCHGAGIVHRDLKPENLFLAERDDGPPRLKVLDFGIAKLLDGGAGGDGAAASTAVIGTPTYMAPEQLAAGGRISPATDIYALGMVAYTSLVGRSYWGRVAGNNVFAVAEAIRSGRCQPASVRARADGGADPPDGFDAWFARATALDPARRYHSASKAVRALANAVGVELPPCVEPAAPPPPPGARPVLPPQTTVVSGEVQVRGARRAVLAVVAATAGAAVLAAGAGLAWRATTARARVRPQSPVVVSAATTVTTQAAPAPPALAAPAPPVSPAPAVAQQARKRGRRVRHLSASPPEPAPATPVPGIPVYLYSRD